MYKINFSPALLRIAIYFKIYHVFRALRLLFVPSFRDLFLKSRRSDVCFDFGANVGDASLVLWLRGCKKIYSFEPHPNAFLKLNYLFKNISSVNPINCAIAEKDGHIKLYLNSALPNNPSGEDLLSLSQSSSILESKVNVSSANYVDIPSSSIESLVSLYGVPNIVKCDIEGGEYIIYKSLARLSNSSNLKHIFLECHSGTNPQWHSLHTSMVEYFNAHAITSKINLDWH